jgi:hypothetical protein
MSIKFEIGAATDKVGSRSTTILEVDEGDLDGVAPDEIEDYVWENLGGKEAANDLYNLWIKRI